MHAILLAASGGSPQPHLENALKVHIVHAATKRFEIWLNGPVAAAIGGDVFTGLAAVGIDPAHFNLQSGSTMRIGLAAAVINSVIGVAGLLVLRLLVLPNQSRNKSAQ
jgi:hypothetical protein